MGMRRILIAAVALAALGAGVVGSASASSALRPAPGTPDPKQMVLTSVDVHANVASQRYYRDTGFPSVISYEREFDGRRSRASKFLLVDSEAEIGIDAQTTASFIAYVRHVFGSKQGRAELKKGFEQQIGDADIFVSDLRIGRTRNLGVGPGSFDLPMSVTVIGLRTDFHIAVFRVERVLGLLVTVGRPGARVPLSTMKRLANLVVGRMSTQLGPRNVSAPTIAGIAQVGQTLTASPGTWRENPTTFLYEWQRCDSSGANCSSIAPAGGPTYVLSSADAGSTIRVKVEARNRYSSAVVPSAPTAVVTAATGPTNTAPPTISGTAQVGQTLSATTGSWTGSPASFGFQWQRCDAAGNACVAIPAATAGTYVLASSDSGSTLRVTVTASNTAGSATATSGQTAVVP
jgi:hypothetical protein